MSSSITQFLPTLNAALNATSAVLLIAGYTMIRGRRTLRHAMLMLTAVATSTAFLACYLTYHALTGRHPFPPGPLHSMYLAILASHSILAAAVPPMVLLTLWRAYRRQWDKHLRLARWALPIWLYVSVTGVVVYWMLYHLAPGVG